MKLYADVTDIPLAELYEANVEIVEYYPRVIAIIGEVELL